MLLLDTRTVPRAERAEAFRAAMLEASLPCRVEQRTPPERMHARMHLVPLGRTAVFTTDATPFGLVRTPRHVQQEGPDVVAIAYQAAGCGEYAQLGHEQLVQGRDLMLVDLTAPYAFGCAVGGGSRSVMVPHEQLALLVDVIRRAVPRLRASPLHDLVRTHLAEVCGRAEELADDAGALALGTATAELVRALIVSAAGGVRDRGAVREETLLTRVRTYVGQHLTDPALTPATIAAAHNVSLRQLYRLFSDAGVSLEQEVIGQRLELARAQLVSPVGRRRSIAATARACGFLDASHFTRRFRRAYGISPRDCQRIRSPGHPS
ncbi:helix-turn-helix domain-containing protein [Modestobacter sp. VKM Ac-2986]|uniref:helix-turn-helix domain-containing protein n=1 Tax=Modestobacter sp. VKM Ac-2986 TaxID=3004140 RepID=UPI0022ABB5B0|nr:helix-turn-helix domain-containing protein [Modestobacter sp. VKM Ac-2986]MCZ2830775.1 helix-turn-helix domain-containing protein [Modestobacter sp. VKM Ac-2986]